MAAVQFDQPPPPKQPPSDGASESMPPLEGPSDGVVPERATWLFLNDTKSGTDATAVRPVWQALLLSDQERLNAAVDRGSERIVGVCGGRWEVVLPRETMSVSGDEDGHGSDGARSDSLGGDWGGRTMADDAIIMRPRYWYGMIFISNMTPRHSHPLPSTNHPLLNG